MGAAAIFRRPREELGQDFWGMRQLLHTQVGVDRANELRNPDGMPCGRDGRGGRNRSPAVGRVRVARVSVLQVAIEGVDSEGAHHDAVHLLAMQLVRGAQRMEQVDARRALAPPFCRSRGVLTVVSSPARRASRRLRLPSASVANPALLAFCLALALAALLVVES